MERSSARSPAMRLTLRAEWTKLRTVGSPLWLVVATAALTAGLGAAAAGALQCPCDGDLVRTSLTGIQLGQAVVVVLAVLSIGGEYGTGLMRITLAAQPRRLVVLTAKGLTVSALVVAGGAVGVAASLVAGRLLQPALPLTASTVRAGVGSVAYLALVALLALGVAAIVRSSTAAAGIVLGLLYLFPVLVHVISDPVWQRRIERIAPSNAGLAIQTTVDIASQPIGPWAGLGVLAGWAAAALLAGALTLHLRDA